ncbi:hypothetical protein VTI28DRAFT_5394 [Corynascus sepedonium]
MLPTTFVYHWESLRTLHSRLCTVCLTNLPITSFWRQLVSRVAVPFVKLSNLATDLTGLRFGSLVVQLRIFATYICKEVCFVAGFVGPAATWFDRSEWPVGSSYGDLSLWPIFGGAQLSLIHLSFSHHRRTTSTQQCRFKEKNGDKARDKPPVVQTAITGPCIKHPLSYLAPP